MIDASKYKKLLEKERELLEEELSGVAERSTEDPENWVATPPADLETQSDPNDAADDIEEYGERIAIEKPLEERLKDVTAALAAMAAGTYGTCKVGGKSHPIEEGRLEANPAALTCVAHMNLA